MVYSEAQKRATYKYRARVKDTEHFKGKVKEYTARGWQKVKDDPDLLALKRTYEREKYRRDPDRIIMSIRKLFV